MAKETVGIKQTNRETWRLTFDGKVLGISGYSKQDAIREARNTVANAPEYFLLDKELEQ
jgi:hypothetical protein